MTLQELHDACAKLLADGIPPDAQVFTEGCDCTGEASILTVETAGDGTQRLMLEREDGERDRRAMGPTPTDGELVTSCLACGKSLAAHLLKEDGDPGYEDACDLFQGPL